LRIILKPSFIIAIVAVAMIGMMVPNVFAEKLDADWINSIRINADITDEEIIDVFEYLLNLDYYDYDFTPALTKPDCSTPDSCFPSYMRDQYSSIQLDADEFPNYLINADLIGISDKIESGIPLEISWEKYGEQDGEMVVVRITNTDNKLHQIVLGTPACSKSSICEPVINSARSHILLSSEPILPNENIFYVFNAQNVADQTIEYFCAIHPWEKESIQLTLSELNTTESKQPTIKLSSVEIVENESGFFMNLKAIVTRGLPNPSHILDERLSWGLFTPDGIFDSGGSLEKNYGIGYVDEFEVSSYGQINHPEKNSNWSLVICETEYFSQYADIYNPSASPIFDDPLFACKDAPIAVVEKVSFEYDVPEIVIDFNFDVPSYLSGETIYFSGKIANPLYLQSLDFIIFNPDNEELLTLSTGVYSDGTFSGEISTFDYSLIQSGTYTIRSQHAHSSYFYDTFEMNTKSNSMQEREREIKDKLSFVDPEKDLRDYIKRYVNEPTYKEWFDTSFPEYMFWEGIGISEEEYLKTVNDSEYIPKQTVKPITEIIPKQIEETINWKGNGGSLSVQTDKSEYHFFSPVIRIFGYADDFDRNESIEINIYQNGKIVYNATIRTSNPTAGAYFVDGYFSIALSTMGGDSFQNASGEITVEAVYKQQKAKTNFSLIGSDDFEGLMEIGEFAILKTDKKNYDFSNKLMHITASGFLKQSFHRMNDEFTFQLKTPDGWILEESRKWTGPIPLPESLELSNNSMLRDLEVKFPIDSTWKSGEYSLKLILLEYVSEADVGPLKFNVNNPFYQPAVEVIPEQVAEVIPEQVAEVIPEQVAEVIPESAQIASFVDTSKDPQSYVERYNNEPTYKQWFDENYSQYSSIYQAVGLEKPIAVVEQVAVVESEYTPEPIAEVASTPNCGAGTESVNGICQVIQTTEKSSGGGCLIATATYGSEMSQQVQLLRELRDNQLLQTESGTAFMGMFNDIYYSFSPVIADYERENPLFKEAVKLAITPMISSLSLMESANSESEVLSIGLSVIMLNIGMYLGVPAIVVIGIRRVRLLQSTL
jgi:hypothetical protein